jgi:spermidine synthase
MQHAALYFLFFLSGVAGLGYEILWTRMLAVGLGHEIVSVLAVVSAFFGGLAAGAWLLDRPLSRSAVPEKWYAALEAVIGVWALTLVWLLPALNPWISDLIGVAPSPWRHWSLSFLCPFLLLLPATAAMGGTLPAMDRLIERTGGGRQAVAGLYSVNTFGAVGGTLLVTFVLLPAVGTSATSAILAVVNFTGTLGVLLLLRGNASAPSAADSAVAPALRAAGLYPILFLTGMLGIGFEVLMVRGLSQVLQNTVFSFAALLMVFLFGTAVGAGCYQRWRRASGFETTLSSLLLTTAFASLAAVFALRFVEPLFQVLQQFFGSGLGGAVAAELSLALVFFLLPTAAMGATFSHLAQRLRRPDGGVGRALCLNTLGGAAAPILFGIWLLPAIGLQYALLAVPAGYLLCFPRRRLPYAAAGGLLAGMILLVAQDAGPYRFVSLAGDETIVSHQEGVMASVSVVKDARNGLHLKVNNRYQMGGTTSVFSDQRQAFFPLLLHSRPKQALFLGLGAGVTFAAAGQFPDLQAEGVELVPEVITAMPYFEKATGDFDNYRNLQIVNADARRYVSATDKRYDVIVADLFHPSRDGAGSLYTVEHFRAIRRLLDEGGVFCQWLPLYQMDLLMFKLVARTFLEVFPDGQAYLSHYSIDQPIIGLVGARRPLRFPENWFRKRVPGKSFRRHMTGFGYDSIYSLLGTFMADSTSLRRYAGDGPLNTDAFPAVLFGAPRFVYGNPGPPQQRLMALIDAFSPPDPESILAAVVTEEDHIARTRLSAYWAARDSFLALGTQVDRTADATRLYRTTSEPLLAVVRRSVDFSAAYFPLISIAYDIYPHDRDASYELLSALERANPMRPEARLLKQRLFVN